MTASPRTAGPTRSRWVGDVVAGVSVAFIVVPQGLAYAKLAGLPPYTGLYLSLIHI